MSAVAALSDTYASVVTWMSCLAAIAASVNAVELLMLSRGGRSDRVWHADVLAEEWGAFAVLLRTPVFAALQVIQLTAALCLAVFSGAAIGAISALILCLTTFLAALRFRGSVNGGSDGMLFTVLAGLAVTQWPGVPDVVREGSVLYVAAQLTLSYLRAGFVKVRERAWWTGDALGAFLSLRAYGVPGWVPRHRAALIPASVGVMVFECLAPLAWMNATLCLAFVVAAVLFHAGTAAVFGLNRFLVAWSAALPALWFAMQRAA